MHRIDVDRDRVRSGDRAAVLVGGEPSELEAPSPLVHDVAEHVDLARAHVVVLVEDVSVRQHASVADRAGRLVVPDDAAFGVDADQEPEVRCRLPRHGRGRGAFVTGKSVMPGAIFVGSLVTVNVGMSVGRAPVVNVTGSAVAVCPLASVAVTVNV